MCDSGHGPVAGQHPMCIECAIRRRPEGTEGIDRGGACSTPRVTTLSSPPCPPRRRPAGTVTYSQTFVGLTRYNAASPQCSGWIAFLASIDPATAYNSVRVATSLGSAYECNDPTAAYQICQGLRTAGTSATSISCNGRTWLASSNCGPALHLGGGECICNSAAAVRPCSLNSNWYVTR